MMSRSVAVGVFVLALLFLPSLVSAYDEDTTHPALTDQIIDLYNQVYPDKITPEEKEWIIEGSVHEDIWPRWINHFYDPGSGLGWTGEEAGRVAAEAVRDFSKLLVSWNSPLSAVDWMTNYSAQQSYAALGGNRSWREGMKHWSAGNKEEAYRTLGHILHLLEDMGVPDHTRNDTHAEPIKAATGDPGSPLEGYATKWNRSSIKGLNLLSGLSSAIPTYQDPAEYLKDTARYSNNYFFSKDTISKYGFPQIIKTDDIFAYGLDNNGDVVKLANVKNKSDFITKQDVKEFFIPDNDANQDIVTAYFPRLARKIIPNGAGLVHLFKQQAEDAAVNDEYARHSDPLRYVASQTASKLVLPNFSILGYLSKGVSAIQSLGRGLVGGVLDGFSWLAGVFRTGKEPSANVSDALRGGDPPSPSSTPVFSPAQNLPKAPSGSNPVPSAPTPREEGLSPEDQLAMLMRQLEELQARLRASQAQPTSTAPTSTPPISPVVFWGGAGAGPSAAASPSGASSPAVPGMVGIQAVEYPVISEIQVSGVDAGDEFVELYNPTTWPIDMSEWSLQYLSGSADDFDSLKKKNFEPDSVIAPRGYFLIARRLNDESADGYRGTTTPDLVHRSISLSGASLGGTVFLVNNNDPIENSNDSNIVDRVAYGDGASLAGEGNAFQSVPDNGQSIERAALQGGTCRVAREGSEFLGNGCDAGANHLDFALRDHGRPQGRESMREPRSAPAPADATFAYSPVPRIDVVWNTATDAEGATSTVRYVVTDTNGTSSLVLADVAGATTTAIAIREVGREYHLQFAATDRDGLAAVTRAIVQAPSFFERVAWHGDVRAGKTGFALDLVPSSSRPLADTLSTSTNRDFRMLFAYLNRPAATTSLLTSATNFNPGTGEVMRFNYDRCNGSRGAENHLLVAFNGSSCAPGGVLSAALSPGAFEDAQTTFEMISPLPSSSFTAGDYITLAWYDYAGSTIYQDNFALAAVDATHYAFSVTPPSSTPPLPPQNIHVDFDQDAPRIFARWSATTDPDSYDSALRYEVAYATSTDGALSDWQPAAHFEKAIDPVAGEHYRFAVRAIDDAGSISAPAFKDWEFPSDYVPLPKQLSYAVGIGWAGGGDAQSFVPRGNMVMRGVALWARFYGYALNQAVVAIELRVDRDGVPGDILGITPFSGVPWQGGRMGETVLMFPEPILLTGNTTYWVVPILSGLSGMDGVEIVGVGGNPYPDGIWRLNPDADAYFRIIR